MESYASLISTMSQERPYNDFPPFHSSSQHHDSSDRETRKSKQTCLFMLGDAHLRPKQRGQARREQGQREHPTGAGQRAWGSQTEHPKGAHQTERRPRGRAAGAHPTGHPKGEGERQREGRRTGPGGERWRARRRERGPKEQGPKAHPRAGAGAERRRAHQRAWEHLTAGDPRGEAHRREVRQREPGDERSKAHQRVQGQRELGPKEPAQKAHQTEAAGERQKEPPRAWEHPTAEVQKDGGNPTGHQREGGPREQGQMGPGDAR